ncbi:MAG: sigma-54-dependent transcriptional regulator [Candidatus Limimorpha sp.]
MKKGKILVVDDNAGIRSTLKIILPMYFEQVETLPSPSSLISKMDSFRPNVVLLDMNFHTDTNSGNEGLFWVKELRQMYQNTQVVLFTAYANIELAVEGMKRGAFDFIVKPWKNDHLISTLEAARDKALSINSEAPSSNNNDEMFWGSSDIMNNIRRNVLKIAPTDANVLITGENGTGKDLMAREIHNLSKRKSAHIVCVDAGAITETLFESELFGHIKGAFTDAFTDHIGKFEQANGGTLFIDEIGNIPLHLQVKLLRALQNRTICRVGSEKEINIDIRLICATNKNLENMVKTGLFREDLFYRINTVHIDMPSLRQRADDIIPLSEIFIKKFNEKYHRTVSGISCEAKDTLISYPWKGNIRELQNCIEKAIILCDGNTLGRNDLQLKQPDFTTSDTLQGDTLDQAEERTIREALDRCNGNLSLVAKSLGISRPTLYSKLKKYNI